MPSADRVGVLGESEPGGTSGCTATLVRASGFALQVGSHQNKQAGARPQAAAFCAANSQASNFSAAVLLPTSDHAVSTKLRTQGSDLRIRGTSSRDASELRIPETHPSYASEIRIRDTHPKYASEIRIRATHPSYGFKLWMGNSNPHFGRAARIRSSAASLRRAWLNAGLVRSRRHFGRVSVLAGAGSHVVHRHVGKGGIHQALLFDAVGFP